MDCADQTYHLGSQTNPHEFGLYAEDAWFRASLDENKRLPHLPTLTRAEVQQGEEESPFDSNRASSIDSADQNDGFGRGSFEQLLVTEPDLMSESLFNLYCNNTPRSVDEQDSFSGGVGTQDRRSRWMENAAQGSEPDKDGRLARRQAQNREAQRAHRAKQKSKLSTLESRVKLAESNCRLLEEANQRMEDVLRSLVNDAVKVLASPARANQPGQRSSRFATS